MKRSQHKKRSVGDVILHLFFCLFTLCFLVPFLYVISISFSNEELLSDYGYKLIPMQWDLSAYEYIFNNTGQLVDSYRTTAITSIIGTVLGVFLMAMAAYPISVKNFKYRKVITFYFFFTMIFGGGLIPSYIINTQYLGLKDSILVYIIPGLVNAWNIIVIRTFYQGLPVSLFESARIDGASEYRIFLQIVLPLSKPAIASIGLITLLGKWNDWYTSMIYINSKELYSLQYLLQKILMDAEFLNNMARNMPMGMINVQSLMKFPTESMRFAMCIIAAGPMLVIFPFFQKYFTRGLTIGSVKG